jgi:hypothetical protein
VDKGIGPQELRDGYLTTDSVRTRLTVPNTRIVLHAKNELACSPRHGGVTPPLCCSAPPSRSSSAVSSIQSVADRSATLTTISQHVAAASADDEDARKLSATQIEALFPADPELMVSPEGDTQGLREVQKQAVARRAALARA